MGFRKDAYATVWRVESISPTLTKAQLSISRKNKDGEYEQDFGSYVAFIGTAAAAKAARLTDKDRIKLGDIDVSTKYDKEKKIMYTNFKIFSFETEEEFNADKSEAKTGAKAEEKNEPDLEIDDSNLPF